MKSDVFDKKLYIECACESPDHLLIFQLYEWSNGEKNIWAFIANDYRPSFWKRIGLAFSYIFKKDYSLTSDSVLITQKNIKQLEEFIEEVKAFNDV